jgi:hypothetical protein
MGELCFVVGSKSKARSAGGKVIGRARACRAVGLAEAGSVRPGFFIKGMPNFSQWSSRAYKRADLSDVALVDCEAAIDDRQAKSEPRPRDIPRLRLRLSTGQPQRRL